MIKVVVKLILCLFCGHYVPVECQTLCLVDDGLREVSEVRSFNPEVN